jgi:hypothetical protein
VRLCRICNGRTVEREASLACLRCGQRIAEFALTADFVNLEPFWNVSEKFLERRVHLLRLAEHRVGLVDAPEISAGLATGYLKVGLLDDALITAALSIRFGPTAVEFCWCAIDVLLHERLLTTNALSRLASKIVTKGP